MTGLSAKSKQSFSPRHRWLLRLMLLVLSPVLTLLILETSLRAMNLGVPRQLYLVGKWRGEQLATENPHFTRKYFGSRLERAPWVEAFPVPKPKNEFRVFLLGESAALGDPIPRYGMARILEILLQEQMKDKRVRVINSAITAINSHAILEIAREVAGFEPDAIVIYAGNNEVVGPYGPGTVFTAIRNNLALIRMTTWLRGTRTGQLLGHLANSFFPPAEKNWRGMEMFLDRQVERNDPSLEVTYNFFGRNLQAILNTFTRRNVPVVISSVAINLRDCAPLASPQPGDEANQNFLLARQWESMGDFEVAKGLYREAMEYDTLRFRADTRINQIIHETSTKYNERGVIFVDGAKLIEENSANLIPGEQFFYDHVHLNFAGQYLLARQFATALTSHFSWLSEDEVAQRLGWGPWSEYEAWQEMYTRRLLPPFTDQIDRDDTEERWANRLIDLSINNRASNLHKDEIEAVRRALSIRDGRDALLWRQLAQACIEVGYLPEAATAYSHAAHLLPHRLDISLSHAALLAAVGNRDEGLKVLHNAGRKEQKKEDLLILMARQLVTWGLISMAEPLFQRASLLNPNHPEALAGLGTSRAASGWPEEGIAMLRAALPKLNNDDMVAANLGIALYQSGEHQEGIRQMVAALRINPENTETLIALATMYREQKELEKARARMEEALILRPLDVPLLVDAAGLAETQERWADAVRYYERALRLLPADATLWFNLARSHAANNDYRAAESAVRKCLELIPNDPAILYLASQIFLQTESRAEAIELLRRAIRLLPKQDGWQLTLAWILATHPDESLRKPQSALEVVSAFSESVAAWMRLDIEAAALAGADRMVEAARKIDIALSEKDIPEESRRTLQRRQALYREGKPYIADWSEFVPQ